MAKKTNKTDHVLNLLSSGKKTSAKEENDAPPVDLRRKAPEPVEEDPLSAAEELPEPRMAEPDDHELPEPKITETVEEEGLPEPRITELVAEPELETKASPVDEPATQPKAAPVSETVSETKVTVEMAPKAPGVSVVHTANDDSQIADAVRDSLEAEFNEYLREKGEIPAEPETERFIEWEMPKPKEPTEINVFELMRESEEEDNASAEEIVAPTEQIEEPAEQIETPTEQIEEPTKQTEEPTEQIEEPAEQIEEPLETVLTPDASVMEGPVGEKTEPDTMEEEIGEPAQEEETPPAAAEEPAAEPAAPKEEPMEEKEYTMVNVMEYLVRDQAPRYIRQFGHCDCDRCIEDTVALTLTHLPAKYVVVNKNAVSPLLNFYEKKYAGQLIVEITKATMIVNESPNH